MFLGWSSHLYPLEADDFVAIPDYAGPAIPDSALPADEVILLIRPDAPDALVRGRASIRRAAHGVIDVRIVFVPTAPLWNPLASLVRVWRNHYRYHGTGCYHIAPEAVRKLKLERTIRSLEHPQRRGNKDRKAAMAHLVNSLKTQGYDDAHPITMMLCRTGGIDDSVHQGHHRVSACLACHITRMSMVFSAAGTVPWEHLVRRGAVALPIADAAELERLGASMGLADCRLILANKYINDAFYEGTCNGRACVVKCSSKCPWSIGNEYRLARRLFAVAPTVVAEPLAVREGPQAFVVTERVAGPSLTELIVRGVTAEAADRFAADIREMARALRETGILHRDLFTDNLLLGADGHLKMIDFQLAIDRADYREDPWVERHWKFHYVVFGVNRDLGLGTWNDFYALVAVLGQLPQTDAVRRVATELAADAPKMTFAAPPRGIVRFKLGLYAVSLTFQMLLRAGNRKRYDQLKRRRDTIWKGA